MQMEINGILAEILDGKIKIIKEGNMEELINDFFKKYDVADNKKMDEKEIEKRKKLSESNKKRLTNAYVFVRRAIGELQTAKKIICDKKIDKKLYDFLSKKQKELTDLTAVLSAIELSQ